MNINIGCFSIIIVFGLLLYLVVFYYLAPFPYQTNNIADYSKVLNQWNSNIVHHFPKSIPKSATLKKLSCSIHHLSKGGIQGHLQLRLQLSTEEIKQFYAQFSGKKTKSFFGGDTNSHVKQKEGMPTTYFYTADLRPFFNDYEIMIFDKITPDTERTEGFRWNHGTSHGVAISKKRNEIVYWAEAW